MSQVFIRKMGMITHFILPCLGYLFYSNKKFAALIQISESPTYVKGFVVKAELCINVLIYYINAIS